MAHKKSFFILVIALILMASISTGCERSYAPIEEGLATPTIEGGAFPDELPSDMEGVFEAGSQTATAEAIAATGGTAAEEPTAVPVVEEPTAVPAAEGETEAAPTTADTATEAVPPTATSTAPVLLEPTATDVPSVNVNNLPASYTLQKGEFPYCIARRFNINPSELLSLNGISSAAANALQPGLTLKIPQTGNPFPDGRARNTHPVTYIVPQTTTVYDIACFFGDVDPAKIISMNSISNADSVAAGTSLQIP